MTNKPAANHPWRRFGIARRTPDSEPYRCAFCGTTERVDSTRTCVRCYKRREREFYEMTEPKQPYGN